MYIYLVQGVMLLAKIMTHKHVYYTVLNVLMWQRDAAKTNRNSFSPSVAAVTGIIISWLQVLALMWELAVP